MNDTLETAIHDLVKDCESHGQPVRGLFALCQLRREVFMRPIVLEATQRLCERDTEGERFQLFPKTTINLWMEAHRFTQTTEAWTEAVVFGRRKAMMNGPVGGMSAMPTAMIPSAWSLVGLASELGMEVLFHSAIQGASRLTDGGPALGDWIERRGLSQPLGCWVPAFVEEGRTNDLMDAAVTGCSPQTVRKLLAVLEKESIDPEILGRYLAHQAAHALDACNEIVDGMKHIPFNPTMYTTQRMTQIAPRIVALMLNAGARMTQQQWGGPIDDLNNGDRRAFGQGDDRVLELVYPVVANTVDDDTKARTLKRMADDGHDIVIAHRDRADRDRFESTTDLPLHLCAAQDHTKSMGVLLDHGADPRALALQMGMLKTVEAVALGFGHDACVDVLRSHAARGRAYSMLEDIDEINSLKKKTFLSS